MTGSWVPRKRARIALASALAAVVVAELALRAAFPPYRFRDENQECYWVLELAEKVEKNRPDEFRDMQLDPAMGWVPRASFDSGTGQTSNSKGLRGTPETAYERTPGMRRIAVLGDSFTYGLGVADAETYCARLRELLPDSEVLNFGVNGYGTDQQYLYWQREAQRYRPDLVLLVCYVANFHRNAFSARGAPKPRFELVGGELRLEGVPIASPEEFVRQHAPGCASSSRLADLCGWFWREHFRSTDEDAFQRKAELARAIVARLAAEVRGSGAALALVIVPHHDRDYPDEARIAGEFARDAGDAGCPVLDLTSALREAEDARPSEPLYGANRHWNAAGHAFVGERIAAFLHESELF